MRALVKGYITRLVIGAIVGLGVGYVNTALGACTISSSQNIILNGSQYKQSGGITQYGIPNYDQSDFGAYSDNDCGPTAGAMLLGYHDGNGWSCMVEGDQPTTDNYYSHTTGPSPQLIDLGEDLRNTLPYSSITGTIDVGSFLPLVTGSIGGDLKDVAVMRDPGAAAWDWDDDESVSKGTIKSEVRAGRPLMFLILMADPVDIIDGVNASWNTKNGTDAYVSYHWMTTMGFREEVLGMSFFGACFDYLALDDFYVISRTGWAQGGNSTLWYHWLGADMADLYTVEIIPSGTEQCGTGPSCNGECGGKSTGSCWCDSACMNYGDCCADYVFECTELEACFGSCGDTFPSCTCDPEVYGGWWNQFLIFFGGGIEYCKDYSLACE